MLGLGYPGGVAIDKLAATGDPRAVALPRALAGRDDLDFSFSGLKTAVATLLARRRAARGPGAGRFLRELPGRGRRRAGAQVAARARARGAGGAGRLRRRRGEPRAARGARRGGAPRTASRCYIPPPKRCTDNAAMIAAAGTQLLPRGVRARRWTSSVDPGLPLSLTGRGQCRRSAARAGAARARREEILGPELPARSRGARRASSRRPARDGRRRRRRDRRRARDADGGARARPSRRRARILAVERDPDMLRVLAAELGGDAARRDRRGRRARASTSRRRARAAGRPLIVVGNLPYQIASALVLALVDAGARGARRARGGDGPARDGPADRRAAGQPHLRPADGGGRAARRGAHPVPRAARARFTPRRR